MKQKKVVERRVGNTTANIAGYVSTKTASGRSSLDCDDDVARELRGKALDDVYKIAAKRLRESERALRKRYQHLNCGMQRMSLGLRIRGAQS